YFATSLGPKLMTNKKPFNLKTVLIAYNIMQVIYCGYMFLTITIYILPHLNSLCVTSDFTRTPLSNLISNLTYSYFILKATDLLDTIFFVLKKSYRQITFLHVYHHAMMTMISWITARFIPGGSGMLVAYINCFVHVMMYGYYLVSVIYGSSAVGWLKKQVTRLQLVQFCANIVVFGFALLQPTCAYPKWLSFVGLVQNIYMIYGFGNFYYEAYVKPETRKLAKVQ
ncbi:hypothetical protein Trydic_g13406, partial [Trypoxylus dichotomus]